MQWRRPSNDLDDEDHDEDDHDDLDDDELEAEDEADDGDVDDQDGVSDRKLLKLWFLLHIGQKNLIISLQSMSTEMLSRKFNQEKSKIYLIKKFNQI